MIIASCPNIVDSAPRTRIGRAIAARLKSALEKSGGGGGGRPDDGRPDDGHDLQCDRDRRCERKASEETEGTKASEVLARHFVHVFSESPPSQRRARREEPRGGGGGGVGQPTGTPPVAVQGNRPPTERRFLEDADDDAAAEYNEDEDTNEKCSKYLVKFLQGTTDAHDTCEGIMNAYYAAGCSMVKAEEDAEYDDYFNEFTEHACCQALQDHHASYCEEGKLLSNLHLLVVSAVLLLCECAKAVVNRVRIHFLPEAAVCILVGTFCGFIAHVVVGTNIDEMSFDDELFLSVLLPPIIFEAALSVSKYEFKRRRGAIMMFSVFGTIISTFSTGFMVHYLSMVSNSTTFPMLDSLVFGALISSIDPVAILSVLTSLHMDQKDTVFILVFGESLLNDGIAITVFQTLVDRFDGKTNDGSTSADEIFGALATFLVAMFGSILVGLGCGCGAYVYFHFLDKKLPSTMEVGSFFLWALIPYYICDGIEWSGIVAIVVVGFFMDIYIAGPKPKSGGGGGHDNRASATASPPPPGQMTSPGSPKSLPASPGGQSDYVDMDDGVLSYAKSFDSGMHSIRPVPGTERLRLSSTANRHVRFVAHLTAQLCENAIFAYLGLFLFSSNYNWDPALITIAIASCVVSRAFMVLLVSNVIVLIYRYRGRISGGSSVVSDTASDLEHTYVKGIKMSRTAVAIRDMRTQAVLVLAGLRGAVSFALVENVPIYNNVTGEGCEYKPLMKGMTSGAVLFTTFVFGGGAYYILPYLAISPDNKGTNRDANGASSQRSLGSGGPPTHVGPHVGLSKTSSQNRSAEVLTTVPEIA